MYISAIVFTVAAWLIGLFIDANISIAVDGFLCLRVLLPILAMGLCLLRAFNRGKDE